MKTAIEGLTADVERMTEALEILERYNRLGNDLDAYLYDIIQWGLRDEDKPDPEDFGLK